MRMAPWPTSASAPAGPVLRDIHLPPPPGWWPPAPGWWLLAGLLIVCIWFVARRWRQARQRTQRRRALIAMLETVLAQHEQSPPLQAAGLHHLLRRVARRLDPAAATQRGEAWRATLARVAVSGDTIDRLMQLDEAMYRPGTATDMQATVAAARDWLSALPDDFINPNPPRRRRAWRRARDAA